MICPNCKSETYTVSNGKCNKCRAREMRAKPCSSQGCSGTQFSRGLCPHHYREKVKAGELMIKKRGTPRPCCSVCGQPSSSMGLCPTHYERKRRGLPMEGSPKKEVSERSKRYIEKRKQLRDAKKVQIDTLVVDSTFIKVEISSTTLIQRAGINIKDLERHLKSLQKDKIISTFNYNKSTTVVAIWIRRELEVLFNGSLNSKPSIVLDLP